MKSSKRSSIRAGWQRALAPAVVFLAAPFAACGCGSSGSSHDTSGQAGGGADGALGGTGGAAGGFPSGGTAAGGAAAGGAIGQGGDAGGAGTAAGGSGGALAPNFGPAEELATGVNLPEDIATDTTHMYWVEAGSFTPGYQGDGRVVRRAKAGGAVEVLAKGRYWPANIEVDAEAVYWGDQGDYWDTSKPGRIARVGKSGGAVQEITSDAVVYNLTSDATTLFFSSANAVKKVPKTGGSKTTLAGAVDALNDIAADPSGVYFTTSTQNGLPVSQGMGTVQRVSPSGGILTLLAEAKSAGGVAVTPAYVFFGTKGTIMRMPKAGGTPMPMATSSGVSRIATDDTNVYWTDCTSGSVLTVPIEGGEPLTLASGYVCPAGLTVEANYVYFTDRGNLNGTISDDHAGRIARIPK